MVDALSRKKSLLRQDWKMLEDAACAMTELEPQLCQAFVAQLSIRSTVLDEVIEQ